jgi:hypothetical protein
MRNEIEKIATEYFKKYTEFETSRDLLSAMNNEESLKSQYAGRELLELVQNADDAKSSEIKIELKKNVLVVSNQGDPFTIESLQRLCQGKVSNKEGNYIGCKGIGFRSVLNWAEEIILYSGKGDDCISVCFSKENAQKKYNDAIKINHVKEQCDEFTRKTGKEAQYPILNAPVYVTPPIEKEFVTVIQIKLLNEKINDFKEEIASFDKQTIIFLPNLNKITINIDDDKPYSFSKQRVDETTIDLIDKDGLKDSFFFRGEEKELPAIKGKSKKLRMAVAIPKEKKERNYKLFCFFPILNQCSPFNALLHATFCLTDNRNSLDDSTDEVRTTNKLVLSELLVLYIDFVNEVIQDERRLSLLQPVNIPINVNEPFKFIGGLGDLECEEFYLSHCKEKKIFQTVMGNFIGVNDMPVVLRNFPKVLENSDIPFLSKKIQDEHLFVFVQRIIYQVYSSTSYSNQIEKKLKEEISARAPEWSAMVRAEILKWWVEQNFTSLPAIVRNAKEEFITNGSIPCFLSGSITNAPEWAELSVLNKEDETALLTVYASEIQNSGDKKKNDSDTRILPRLIKRNGLNFAIQEQSSREELISPVNNSINHDYLHAKEFVVWLWNIWKQNEFADSIKNIVFNLPTVNGNVIESKHVYLGEAYGNQLGDDIFKYDSTYEAFPKIDLSQDSGEEVNEKQFEKMLLALGVRKLPALYVLSDVIKYNPELSPVNPSSDAGLAYIYIKNMLAKNKPCYNLKSSSTFKYSLCYVENLTKILEKLDDVHIFCWLLAVDSVRLKLLEDREDNSSYVSYIPIKCQYFYTYAPSAKWEMPSFLKFAFSEMKWIKIGSEKYSPNSIVLSDDAFIRDKVGLACLTEDELESKLNEINKYIGKNQVTKEQFETLLIALGVKPSLLSLDSNTFYKLLNVLPSFGKDSKRTSRAIYRDVIDNYQNDIKIYKKFFEDSEEKKKFFETGLVLARVGDSESEYKPVKDVYFSSSAIYHLDNLPLIDVPSRSGKKEDFLQIFNINEPPKNYQVKGFELSELNKEFNDDLKNTYLPALLTYKKGKTDEISKLIIRLVKSIDLQFDGGTRFVDQKYALVNNGSKNSWLIFIGEESNYNELRKDLLANCFVQIFNVFFNYPAKDFLEKARDLFICPSEYRKSLILADFGSMQSIEENENKLKLSESRKREVVEKVLSAFNVKEDELIKETIGEINWLDTDSFEEQKKIIALLRSLGKDIQDLNQILDMSISLVEYNKKTLFSYYEEKEDKLKLLIYSDLVKKSLVEKKKLRSRWEEIVNQYRTAKGDFEHVDYNKENHFAEIFENIKKQYQIEGDLESIDDYPFAEYYKINIKEVKDKLGDRIDEFVNDLSRDSLLYFNDNESTAEVVKIGNEILSDVQKNSQDDTNKEKLLYKEIYNGCVIGTNLQRGKEKKQSAAISTGIVTPTGEFKRQKKNKKQGNFAEYLVVLKLANRGIPEVNLFFNNGDYSIKWVSGASKLINKFEFDNYQYTEDQSNDGAGYDIELVSADKEKKMYIEVKSSSNEDCSFYMSSTEYNEAKKIEKGDKQIYRIVFVSKLDIFDPHCKPVLFFINDSIFNNAVFKAFPSEYNMVFDRE